LTAIRVVAIAPETYPQFLKDADHPCIGLSEERRLEEIVDVCARTLAQVTLIPNVSADTLSQAA
jgi:hypothetical protein